MDTKDMKQYSKSVIENYKRKRFHVEEAVRTKGNWHKYC